MLCYFTSLAEMLFSENEAIGRGGAISLVSCVSSVSGNYVGNQAENGGGAVSLFSAMPPGNQFTDGAKFVSNVALGGNGGAVYLSSGVTQISDAYFSLNNADYGGAIGLRSEETTLHIRNALLNATSYLGYMTC